MVDLHIDPLAEKICNYIDYNGLDYFAVSKLMGIPTKKVMDIYRDTPDDLLKLCAKHSDNHKVMSQIYNALRRNDICTLTDLNHATLDEISEFSGVGKKSIDIIEKMKADIKNYRKEKYGL